MACAFVVLGGGGMGVARVYHRPGTVSTFIGLSPAYSHVRTERNDLLFSKEACLSAYVCVVCASLIPSPRPYGYAWPLPTLAAQPLPTRRFVLSDLSYASI